MATEKVKRTSVSMAPETKKSLDSLRRKGQSRGGVIQELIDFWRRHHPTKEDKG